ncbi:MAG TPA: ATP/GTP-binding protein [Streptosporangiaceae bacterium]|nr:ATP/GTP-binding protein [Streptosporangiaceae bacterium]
MSPRRARRLPDNVPRRPRGGTGAAGRGAEAGEQPEFPAGPERIESWPDGDWVVRQVPGGQAQPGKAYRCPGCDQEIPAGTPHLVAWPVDTPGMQERRHWHRGCWERRLHRRPGIRKGR